MQHIREKRKDNFSLYYCQGFSPDLQKEDRLESCVDNHFRIYEVENRTGEVCLLFKLLTGCVVAAGQCA